MNNLKEMSQVIMDDLLNRGLNHTGCEPSVSGFYRAFDEVKSYVLRLESKLDELEKQEPVAWKVFHHEKFHGFIDKAEKPENENHRWSYLPLYAKPMPAQQSELIEIIKELAEDVKCNVENEYGHGLNYPSFQRKYDAGMDVVNSAKAIVKKYKS